MRKYALPGLAIVMAFVTCGLKLFAEQGPEKTSVGTQSKVGVVKQVDATGGKILVMAARELTFFVTSSTKIHLDSKTKRRADIRVGTNVQVEYTRTGDNRTATSIAILTDAGKSAGTQTRGDAGDQQVTVEVGGQQRTCLLHLPPTYTDAQALPLVIALHGSRGIGSGMAKMTGFNALADRHGFIAAYPDGVVDPRSWNSLFGTVAGGEGVLANEVSDVAFIRALIDKLHATYHTDPKRVFVCGHSSGGYMSYRLALELSDRIAAAGVVNGSVGIKSVDGHPVAAKIPQPTAPISLLHIAGGKDTAVKFQGSQTPKNLFKSAPDCVQIFTQANGCAAAAKETRDVAHGVVRSRYTGGKAGTEVELVVVENCGHEWPGDGHGLSASQALWDFFATHPKGMK